MILILIPLAGIFVGLALWAVLRGMGIMNVLGAENSGSSWRDRRGYEPPSSMRERIAQIRPGCLIGIIAVCGVWLLGWLIVLIVGLSVLS